MNFFNSIFFFFFLSISLFLLSFLQITSLLFLLVALGQSIWTFFFLFYSSLFSIASCCTLTVRGAVCFPPNYSTRTPTDTPMTTALCASPAARMRRGRDERRAEGAVTCGRAARACGAEHTFLFLLFCFYCGQGGQIPAAPHPQPHPAAVILGFCLLSLNFSLCFFSCDVAPFGVGLVSISLPLMIFFLLLRSLSRWRDATPVMSACFSHPSHTHTHE
ncbi:ATPase [Trypanosoma cruzi]|uniref:ATPase n=1 Tax=Trypanosoma cruzi TaxID=5693 RepID=A0A7J6XJV3_TRYCR|nr:ATPase [Trypanosoma cruzi]KAF5218588.1 ATPase [Trypanosoma cruzi]KAF5219860.1 ATPase [Trypanosoma cruzi]